MIMQMYKNKYRTTSTRLKNWDYSQYGWYFITICTKNREHFFGEVINEKMKLSPIGETVKQEWIKTPKIRPDMNLTLDEFIIMPNHFHAIIIIGSNKHNTNVETQCFASDLSMNANILKFYVSFMDLNIHQVVVMPKFVFYEDFDYNNMSSFREIVIYESV